MMAQEQPMHELDHRFLRRLMETELAQAASSEPQSEKDMKRFLEGLRQYFAWQQQGQAEGRWYIAVIEPDHGLYRAYCPVLRDCVATGLTRDEARTRLTQAIRERLFHLRAVGQPLPYEQGAVELVPVSEWLDDDNVPQARSETAGCW
jgi:predicted RNase H-like HicB family nuclease